MRLKLQLDQPERSLGILASIYSQEHFPLLALISSLLSCITGCLGDQRYVANYGQTWSVLIRAKIPLINFLEKGANLKIIIIICL